MLNNLKRRALTLLLSLAMIITYMPTSMIAYAVDGDDDQAQVEQQVETASPADEATPEEEVTPAEEAPPAEEATPAEEEPPAETAKPAVEDTKADAKAETEVGLLAKKTTLTTDGDGYSVSAIVGKDTKVPADTELQVSEIEEGSDEYKQYYEEALKALEDKLGEVKGIKTIKFYDISLEAESQAKSVEPKADVNVKIEYDKGIKLDDGDSVQVVHFGDKKTEVLDKVENSVETTVQNDKMTETSFDTGSFSVFAVIVIENEEGTLTVNQDGYEITINYSEEANIPIGTELVVEKVDPSSKEYKKLWDKTLEKINEGVVWENKDLPDPRTGISDAVFFDISLIYNGKEIEPEVPLSVHISNDADGLYIPKGEEVKIVHFADKGTEIINDFDVEKVKLDAPKDVPRFDVVTDIEYQQDSFSVIGEFSTGDYSDPETSVISKGPIKLAAPLRAGSSIAASKTVTDDDGDGVYEMALSVTGASESSTTTKVDKANVVLVIDTSGSMQNNYTYSTYTYSPETYSADTTYYRNTSGGTVWHWPGGNYNGTYHAAGWYRGSYGQFNTAHTGTVYTRQTRMEATKTAAVALVDELFSNNKNQITEDGVNLNDIIEISLVTFAGASNTARNGYLNVYNNTHFSGTTDSTSASQLKNYINGLTAVGGTNWEQALKAAKTSADTYSSQTNEKTSVIFLTDGKPTFYGANDSGDGQEGDANVQTSWNNARDDARTIVEAGYTLYNIFAFGTDTGTNSGSNFLKALTNYAYTGSGTYSDYSTTQYTRDYFFDARDTDALTDAFKKIISNLTDQVGFGGVDYEDGVTVGVTNTSVTVDGTVHDGSFRYTVRNSNNNIVYTVHIENGTATFTIGGNTYTDNSPETVTTVVDPADHSKDIESIVYSVEVDGKTYAMSPAVINKTTGLVDWDLAGLGILENGYTYTVAFDVWPNQDAYDTVADLNNGLITKDQVPQSILDSLVGPDANNQYAIRTNWKQEVNYYSVDTVTDDQGHETTTYTPQPTKEIEDPDPVLLTSKPLPMIKVWASNLSPDQIGNLLYEDYPDNTKPTKYQVTLHLWRADTAQALQDLIDQYAGDPATASAHDYIEKTLGWSETAQDYVWTDSVSIAPGTMVSLQTAIDMGIDVTTAEHQKNIVTYGGKQYYIIEKGHYYYVTEDQIDWHFVLETVLYHPMMVDGTLSNVTFITDEDGNITGVEDIEDMTNVTATNSKTAELDITKLIKDDTELMTDAQKEAETFTYKVKLTVPADADMTHTNALEWVPRLNDPITQENRYYIFGYQSNEEAEVLGLDDDVARFNQKVYGQYTVSYPGGGAILDEIFTPDAGGETKSGTIYITLRKDEVIRFTNLPAGTQYRIEEMYNNLYQANPSRDADANLGDNAPASNIEEQGYTVTVKTKNGNPTVSGRVVTGTIDKLNKRYYNQFTNTLNAAVVDLQVTKHLNGYHWDSAGTPDPHRYYVKLEAADENTPLPRITQRYLSSDSGADDVSFDFGLVHYTEPGTYTYTIKEYASNWTTVLSGTTTGGVTYDDVKTIIVNVADDFSVTVDEESSDGVAYDDATGSINTTVTNSMLVDLEGTKTWNDDSNRDGLRPTSVTVTLMAAKVVEGAELAWAQVSGVDPYTTDASKGWQYSFTDLPKYADDGAKLVYKIVETVPDGYTAEYTSGEADAQGNKPGFVEQQNEDGTSTFVSDVKNTHEIDKTKVKATKTWSDSNNQDGKRPEDATVQLYKTVDGVKTAVGDPVTVPKTDGTIKEWTDLPVKEGGKQISYSVEETLPQGSPYTKAGDGELLPAVSPDTGTVAITNSYSPEITKVTATKTWSDNNNQDGKRPADATVQLYKTVDGVKTAVGDPVTVPATDGTIKEWTGLPVYEGGKQITYSVEETLPPKAISDGYVKSGDTVTLPAKKDDSGTVAITNTYTPESTKVTATKTWSDSNNQDGKRPADATVQLYKTVGGVKTAVGDPVTVPKDGGTIKEWTGLPVYENGRQITYSVEETLPPKALSDGYTKSGDDALLPAVVGDSGTVAIINSYTPEKTKINATKTWSDNNNQDGKRPDNATVQLYKTVGETKTPVGEAVTVPKNGGAINEWTDLPVYEGGVKIKYSIEETLPEKAVSDGYAKSGDGALIEAVSPDTGTVAITNRYTPESTKVTATKTWSDNNDQDGKRPADATVQLYKTVGETKTPVGDPVTVPKNGGTINDWTGLPVYENGTQIIYSVEETLPEKAEEDGYTKSGDDVTLPAVVGDSGTVAITNSYTPEKTKIDATKTWSDNNNQDGKRPADATVQLYKTVGETKTPVGDPVTVPKNGGAINEWTDLPVYEGGVKIKYSVEETLPEKAVSDGYTKSGDGALIEAVSPDTGTVAITNSYTPEVTKVTATKTWSDNNDQDGKRPADATVQLYKKVGEAEKVAVGDPVTVPKNGGTINEWTGLPVYENGTQIIYSVEETLPEKAVSDGYTKSGDDVTLPAVVGDSGTVAITNSYTPEKTKIDATKTWSDNNNQDGKRPDNATVQLYKTVGETKTPVGDPVTVPKNGGAINEWTDLPVYEGGVKIKYSIEETLPEKAVTDGYTKSGDGELIEAVSPNTGTVAITNSYTPEKTKIDATKTWSDNNDQDGKRPEDATVQLYKTVGETKTPVGDPVTVPKNGGAINEWTDLPVYEGGVKIKYSVEETLPEKAVEDGYTKSGDGALIEAVSPNTGTVAITNSYTPEVTKITATKTWADSDDQDGKRPADATVQLYKTVGETKTPVEGTVTVPKAGGTIHEWTNLPVYEGGVKIKYSVEETLPEKAVTDGYTKSGDGELIEAVSPDTGTVAITNSYTPEEIEATVIKVWDDNNNQDGKRPDDLEVALYADNVALEGKTVTLTEDNEWTDSIAHLPRFKNGGTEISYSWVEEDLSGIDYTQTGYDVRNVTEEGKLVGTITTITNKHTPEETEAHVVKVWNDNDDKDGKRPSNVYIKLYSQAGEAEPKQVGNTIALNADNGWKHDWAELDKYEDGVELVYTVEEDPVPDEYTVEITPIENQTFGYTVTNSYQSEPEKDVFTDETSTTSIDGKIVAAGDELTYKIEYVISNPSSKEKATEVVITDTVPDFTTLKGTPTSTVTTAEGTVKGVDGVVSGRDITWTFTDEEGFDNDTKIVAIFTVTVDEDKEPVIENTGHVRKGENESDTNVVYNSKPVKDVFEEGKMTTSIDGKVVKPGDILTYQITYVNEFKEEDNVKQIKITDVIPDHTEYVPDSAKSTVDGKDGDPGVESNGTITWTFGSDAEDAPVIPRGTKYVVTFNVKVLDDQGTVVENHAEVQEGENKYDTNIVTNSKPVKDVFAEGDLTTSIDGKVVKPGDILTYQVKYTNTSKEFVEQIDITDVVPEHTEYVANTAKSTVNGEAGPDGTEDEGTITWTFPGDPDEGIAEGTEFVVTFNVEVLDDEGTVIENQAKVNDGNNKYDTNIVTNSKPHKDVFEEGKMTTSIDGQIVKPGDVLTYQIKYTNTSKDKVEQIDITDVIPAHTKFVEGSAKSKVDGKAGPDGAESAGTITWTFTDDSDEGFAAGTEFEATFNVEVLDDGGDIIENQAKIQDGENEYDTNVVTNSKPVKDVFEAGKMTTSIDGQVVKPDDVLTYQVKFTNKSKEFVEQIDITDAIPEHTEYVANTAKSTVNGEAGPDGTEDKGVITWTFTGDPEKGIAKDTEFVVTFNVKVLDDEGTVIENQANVNDGKNSSDTNIVTNSKSHKDVFEEGKMTTSIDGQIVKPGDVLTYQIKYTNVSKDKVEQIDITDEIPDHTKFVEGSAKSKVDGKAGPDGSEDKGVITWTFTGDEETGIANGTEFEVTFNVEVLDDGGDIIENQAKIQDGENEYDTNVVTNSKPVKDVFEAGKMTTSIDGKVVKPGDVLTYQVKFTNKSKEFVEQIDITDAIPEHTEYAADTAKSTVNGEAGPDGTEDKGVITWTFTGDEETGIAYDTEFVVTFNVKVLDDAGTVIENQANVNDGKNSSDTNIVTNSKPHKDVFEEGKMTTSIDGQIVKPGDVLTYQIKYTNVSKDKVEQIDITDVIPAHTKFVEGSAKSKVDGKAGPDGAESAGTITWTFTDDSEEGFAVGTEFEATFNVEVLDDGGDIIENQAKVQEGENEYDTNIVTNSKPVKDVFAEGDLTTSIDGKVVKPGDVLTYQVKFTNKSKEFVEQIDITDAIPEHTEYVANTAKSTVNGKAGPDGTEDKGVITWTFTGDPDKGIEEGTELVATFNVKVLDDKGTVIENQAKVNDGKNSSDTNIVVNSKPVKDVFEEGKMTTSIDGRAVQPGDVLTYQIDFVKTSKDPAEKVEITDAIPEHTEFVAGSAKSTVDGAAGPDGTEAGGTITWTFENADEFAVGTKFTATFNVKVLDDQGTVIENQSKVQEGDNSYDTNEVVNSKPVKDVFDAGDTTTSIDGDPVDRGQELTYSITYKNVSKEAQDVTITDEIPAFTAFVEGTAKSKVGSAAGPDGTESKGTITWAIGTVKPGEVVVATFNVIVSDEVSGETLVNDADVKEGKNTFKTNEVTNPTPPKKDVFTGTSTTSINGEEVFPGQELTYAITFENSKAEEVDVTITDVIPKYTTYVDGSADKEGKYDAAKNMITWETKAPAAKGGKAGELTVTFKVTVDPDAGGQTLKNEGTLREGKDGPEMKTNPVENPVTIELVITKDLRNFVQHEGEDVKATFGFKITGESAKRGAYSNVVAMEFTGAEVKELTVKGIPSDIKNLKVEEIVSGNYTPSTDGVKLDEKDGKYKVTFTNKYDDTDYKTGTINNYKRGDDGKYSKNGTGDNKSQKPTQTTEQPAEETQPNESGN